MKYLYSNRLNLGIVRDSENVFWSLASHDISIFTYLLDSKPIIVSAVGICKENKNNIEDSAFINLIYPKNIIVNIQVSWLSPQKVRSLAFPCPQETISRFQLLLDICRFFIKPMAFSRGSGHTW